MKQIAFIFIFQKSKQPSSVHTWASGGLYLEPGAPDWQPRVLSHRPFCFWWRTGCHSVPLVAGWRQVQSVGVGEGGIQLKLAAESNHVFRLSIQIFTVY